MMAANGSQPAGQLLIPVYGSDEMVEVPLDALPEVVDDVIDILKAEGAPLALWLDLARAYLAQVRAQAGWGGAAAGAVWRVGQVGCRPQVAGAGRRGCAAAVLRRVRAAAAGCTEALTARTRRQQQHAVHVRAAA